ncbi:MAG: hypothetical protein ACK5VF_01660 [Bacteroidota bacterium]
MNKIHGSISTMKVGFLASGAEQRVYLDQDSRFVYKLNDTIFYQFWLDYFYLPISRLLSSVIVCRITSSKV